MVEIFSEHRQRTLGLYYIFIFCHCWSVRLEQSSRFCPQPERYRRCFQAPAKDSRDATVLAFSIKLHLRLKTHGVENRRLFSTPIRTCCISRSIFGSTWSIETVVIGLCSLFSFGLFVNSAESVNKHFDYIFIIFVTICKLYECIIAASSSSFFDHVCFRSRKPAPIFEVENRRRFSTPCVFSLKTGGRMDRDMTSFVRPPARQFVSWMEFGTYNVRSASVVKMHNFVQHKKTINKCIQY